VDSSSSLPLAGDASPLLRLSLPQAARLSTSDFVAGTLREAIVSGQLGSGTLLKQDELAERFHVSKIPVREALKRLEAEGLVSFIRNKGALVASMSPDEIWEYVEIRAMLEARAAELSAPRISDANLEKARAALEAFGSERNPPAGASSTGSCIPPSMVTPSARCCWQKSVPCTTRWNASCVHSWP